jgi:hypothetical protein
MFAFDRSAVAVLIPLALLLAVVIWSNQPQVPAAVRQAQSEGGARPASAAVPRDQTVAASLASR